MKVTGEGDAGSGGDIDIMAGTDVVIGINGKLQSNGTGSSVGSGGGDGGAIFINAGFGDITVYGKISVQSGSPDGGGGDIEMFALASIEIEATAELIADGNGFESDGGAILLDAGFDATINGPIHSDGGDSGGEVGIEAGRDIAVNAPIGAVSTNQGSFGGSITLQAGLVASGNVTIASTVDVSGPGCDAFGFCSLGGDIDISSCDLTVELGGFLDARAPGSEGSGGAIFLAARNQLTILGSLDATGGGGLLDGSNELVHPIGILPTVTGSVLPAPTLKETVMCTGGIGDPNSCLNPCPSCGNGVTEFPETCDDSAGTPLSCDGCSGFCQLEECDDASPCTIDSCDPLLGCRNAIVPNGTSCADETVCNGEEVCSAGLCVSSGPLDCDDGNQCTQDSCDPVAGCQNDPTVGAPCDDGDMCTDNDTCDDAGTCVPGGQVVCVDGNECTEDDCDPGSGCVFAPLTATPCTADQDPCTADLCSVGTCVHVPMSDGATCDDDDPCSLPGTCQAGLCTGITPVICTALDQCHDAGVCNPSTGICSHPQKQDGTTCDDASLCTQDDRCQAGICAGTPTVICTALDQCHDVGECEPSTGICSHPPKPDGTLCSDGLFCTVDSCQNGTCTSTARDCSDPEACMAGYCDEDADTCVQEPVVPCCGNGIVEGDEDCDEGPENSDEPNSICRTDCTRSECGNGVVDDLMGEACDLGQANSDEPNSPCRTDCLARRCGDGIVDDLSAEQCDGGEGSPDEGCSPRCFFEPPPTASFIPGNGSSKTDCIIEWKMENVALDKKGRPSVRQSCTDGDESCDADGMVNNECIFHVWLCSNSTDPGLPLCEPGSGPGGRGDVIVVQVKKPSLRQAFKKPVDGENRQGLSAAATAASENSPDACGPRLGIRVPLKVPGKKGVKSVRLRATTSLNVRDTDVLKLTCLP